MKYKSLAALFVCIFAAGNLHAGPRKITIRECVNIALQNHPNIMMSIEDRKNAVANYKLVNAKRNILVNGEMKTVEYLKSSSSANEAFNIPGKDTNIGLFAGLTASYNLYDSKKRQEKDQARISIDLSKIASNKIKDDIVLNVKKTYYEYLIAKENTRLRKQLADKFADKLKLARSLFRNGQRPILDVSKAEMGHAEAMLNYERAKNKESIKKVELYTSMGIKDLSIDIEPVDIKEMPELKYSAQELFQLSQIYYPELRRMKLMKKIKKLNISVQKAARQPSIDMLFSLGYENKNLQGMSNVDENFQTRNWNPTFHGALKAYFPVYSGGAITARIESAVTQYNKVSYEELQVLNQVENLITAQYRILRELKEQIRMSGLVTSNAEKHLLLAQRSYENGTNTLLNLQDAEVSVIRAELGHVNARYDYLMIVSRLANIAGLSEDDICK